MCGLLGAESTLARRSDDTKAIWGELSDVPSLGRSGTSRRELGGDGGGKGCRDSRLPSRRLSPRTGDGGTAHLPPGAGVAPNPFLPTRAWPVVDFGPVLYACHPRLVNAYQKT